MRALLFPLAVLAACAPASERPSEEPPLPPPAENAWLICDGIDAPAVLAFERDGDRVRVAEYDKPNGAIVERYEFTLGDPEGAVGSVFTPLLRDGADAGHVRAINPGTLDTPGAAYTAPVTSVRLGERDMTCRWLTRTRLMGFTERRSFVVSEDADGDLIYTGYDFANAAAAQAIQLSDGGQSTTFSIEVRGGQETLTPAGVEFRFTTADGHVFLAALARDGAGRLDVSRDTAPVQSEMMISVQQGEGER